MPIAPALDGNGLLHDRRNLQAHRASGQRPACGRKKKSRPQHLRSRGRPRFNNGRTSKSFRRHRKIERLVIRRRHPIPIQKKRRPPLHHQSRISRPHVPPPLQQHITGERVGPGGDEVADVVEEEEAFFENRSEYWSCPEWVDAAAAVHNSTFRREDTPIAGPAARLEQSHHRSLSFWVRNPGTRYRS